MFTGIVEEVGKVSAIRQGTGYQRTSIVADRVMEGLEIGDSISIEGACHTVVDRKAAEFSVESVEETLKRTTLSSLRVGGEVNLERSVRLGDRMDGHLVSGHVDGNGIVLERMESETQVTLRIGMPTELSPFVAEKGSITVDGISLTVVSAAAEDFTVALIPHTLSATTISERKLGDRVNLEIDMVARYVHRLLSGGSRNGASELTESALQKMGYDGQEGQES